MSYIEVGATYKDTRQPVPTKTALRKALSQDLASVTLTSVGGLNAPFNGHVDTLNLYTEGTFLIVCGPDPYAERKWWANLKIKSGKVYMDDKVIKPAV